MDTWHRRGAFSDASDINNLIAGSYRRHKKGDSMLRPDIARGSGCLLLAAVLAINAGCATNGSGERPPCDLVNPKDKVYKLKIQTRTLPDGKVEPTGVNHGDGSSANLLHVCPGDTVRWDLKNHEFEIAFQ